MLTEDHVREIVEVDLALLVPVLLGVLVGRFSFDDGTISTMDTRFRLARFGDTETLEASLTR